MATRHGYHDMNRVVPKQLSLMLVPALLVPTVLRLAGVPTSLDSNSTLFRRPVLVSLTINRQKIQ